MPLLPAFTAAPACVAHQLSVSTDGRNGASDGMSHSGTLLILTNRSSRACSLSGLPPVAFRDLRGRKLPITRQVPSGMHPGPVILPVTIAPRARAGTALRWVSGSVYDHSRCYAVRSIAVSIADGTLQSSLRANICGSGDAATFEQPILAADPAQSNPRSRKRSA